MSELKYLAPEVVEQLKLNEPVKNRPIFDVITRLIDILAALAALIIAGFVMIVAAIAVKFYDRGPVFFRQERLGKGGKPFKMFKFRSMIVDADKVGAKLRLAKDDKRITPVGKILREFHLDELPQFFNILAGQMSLVGPRPALTFQKDYYEPWEMPRLAVRCGATGLSQVSGGNALSWDDRIIIDVYYARHRNLFLYFKIVFLTIVQVFYKKGIYTKEGAVKGWTRGVPDWYKDNT